MSAVIPFASPFEAAKRRFEHHGERLYEKLQASNYSYAPEAEYEELERILLNTPAYAPADIAYKAQLSRDCLHDIGEGKADIQLLTDGINAIRAGDLATATKTLDTALMGETDYPFAYEGAAAALADLHRLNPAPTIY